jgi:hypothetical protein
MLYKVPLGARNRKVNPGSRAVEGRSVWIQIEGEDEEQRFDLNLLTAHFVRRGEPYRGTRLALGPSDVA